MIAASLALAAGALAPSSEVPPRDATWAELSPARFDLGWILPDGRGDLLQEMRALAELVFEDGAERRRFGDLVRESRGLSPRARADWLRALEARLPEVSATFGAALRELLQDDHLASDDWHPSQDHPRDGILPAESWVLETRSAPWSRAGVTLRFEQAAVLHHAELASLKAAENDYRTYRAHVGADLEEIAPRADGHLRGLDPTGRPFRFVAVRSRADLPFPFSGYTCDLRILNRVGDDGGLRTDIYSPSRDFHFLAGRDVFLPVRDSAGHTVGYLAVRDFGFDLDGVPDGPRHRREALRGTLGNLKRNAERLAQERARRGESASDADDPAAVLQSLRVLGPGKVR